MNIDSPSHRMPELPLLEQWRWLGCKIRWGLHPDDPPLIGRYLNAGREAERRQLVCAWCRPWHSLRLLYDTACDAALPWHWRSQCLDALVWPLADLQRASGSQPLRQRALLSARLLIAATELQPSVTYQNQGH